MLMPIQRHDFNNIWTTQKLQQQQRVKSHSMRAESTSAGNNSMSAAAKINRKRTESLPTEVFQRPSQLLATKQRPQPILLQQRSNQDFRRILAEKRLQELKLEIIKRQQQQRQRTISDKSHDLFTVKLDSSDSIKEDDDDADSSSPPLTPNRLHRFWQSFKRWKQNRSTKDNSDARNNNCDSGENSSSNSGIKAPTKLLHRRHTAPSTYFRQWRSEHRRKSSTESSAAAHS